MAQARLRREPDAVRRRRGDRNVLRLPRGRAQLLRIRRADGQPPLVRRVRAGDGLGPTVSRGTAYFAAAKYGSGDSHTYLWALDTSTNKFRWTVAADPCTPTYSLTTPVVANGRVYVNGHTFDAGTGAHLFDWSVCPNLSPNLSVTSHRIFMPYASTLPG